MDKTACGAEKFWELGKCLRDNKCPLDKGVTQNLEFLLELRHEIEHRSTSRIDDAVSAKLQACCINFNVAIKSIFGPQYGLERRLPIALQFVTFSSDQKAVLKKASGLPRHIETMVRAFHDRLSPEEQSDPHFAYRVAFVHKTANRVSAADEAFEFIKPGSEEETEINRVLVKEVEKVKVPALRHRAAHKRNTVSTFSHSPSTRTSGNPSRPRTPPKVLARRSPSSGTGIKHGWIAFVPIVRRMWPSIDPPPTQPDGD